MSVVQNQVHVDIQLEANLLIQFDLTIVSGAGLEPDLGIDRI